MLSNFQAIGVALWLRPLKLDFGFAHKVSVCYIFEQLPGEAEDKGQDTVEQLVEGHGHHSHLGVAMQGAGQAIDGSQARVASELEDSLGEIYMEEGIGTCYAMDASEQVTFSQVFVVVKSVCAKIAVIQQEEDKFRNEVH